MIFYDDDPINIAEVSKLNIKCVFISNKPVNLNYKERNDYYKNFVNNSYYDYFKPIGTPCDGFNMNYAQDLLTWLNYRSSRAKPPIVLFDWDKTVTCFDGFSIEKYPFTYNSVGVKIKDVMEYICGGYARLNLLCYVFQTIRKKGEIFILTNNPVSVFNRPEFVKMIQILDPEFNEKCLVYGNGNKRTALLACKYFMSISN